MRQDLVRAVVISLDGSDRIDGFLEQNSKYFDFSIHNAYDARSGGGDEFFDRGRAEEITGRPLLGGEIGCAISHLQVLREFATEPGNDSDLMLVAEDDARLDPDARVVVDRALGRMQEIEYLILSESWGGKDMGSWISLTRNPNARLGNMSLKILPLGPFWNPIAHRVGHVSNEVWGTGLYLVSRRAAKKYISSTDILGRIYWIADDYGKWAKKAGVDIQVCRPGICSWEGETQIKDRPMTNSAAVEKAPSLQTKLKSRIAASIRVERFKSSLRATRHELRGGSFPYSDR